jgi:hypothetical protein
VAWVKIEMGNMKGGLPALHILVQEEAPEKLFIELHIELGRTSSNRVI